MDATAKERYSRQIRFSPIGEDGQAKLLESRVALIGCGALGSFQAGALARAGVGTLDIIDRDYVELSNLQRQWLFEEADAIEGLPKAIAAARRIAGINSSIRVNPVVADVSAANIEDLLADADVILDATDNFETRYLVNDYAIHSDTPWIYGAAVSSYGLVMPVLPGRTSCLKCVYPEPPSGAQPTCETAGVLNTITSLIASLQVSMAYQILVGKIDEVPCKITTVDLWSGAIRQIRQPARASDCQACAKRDLVHLHGRRRTPVSLCGRNAVQIHDRARPIDLADLEQRLKPLGDVRRNDFALRFFLPAHEMTVFPDGRAIIKGTTDVGIARSLYARYIGA
jgi:molybdopterin/thiamine biosynthesis adenylyltransferase